MRAPATANTRIGLAFLALIVITCISAVLGEMTGLSLNYSIANTDFLIIALTAVKVFLVAEYFMELHCAPLWLKSIMMTWLTTTCSALALIIYFN